MEIITKKAFAKINLSLYVTGKRDDGYHTLKGIMHTIDLCDEITIDFSSKISDSGKQIKVICNEQLPENNTCYTAAKSYLQAIGLEKSITITVNKKIPSQSGLGGASADAACVLSVFQEYFHALTETETEKLARFVGADVPFCYRFRNGGCAKAEGIGDILTPLPSKDIALVIVKPTVGVSTKELFCSLSKEDLFCNEINPDMVFNSLEKKAVEKAPEIQTAKNLLLDYGAITASMTGSGSAVFGIYKNKAAALNAAAKKYPKSYFVCTCNTI